MEASINSTDQHFLYQWIYGCLSNEERNKFESSEFYKSLVRSQNKVKSHEN